ncbi:unnamed protein product [Discula destructiva]
MFAFLQRTPSTKSSASSSTLPIYSPLSITDSFDKALSSPSSPTSSPTSSLAPHPPDLPLQRAQRHALSSKPPTLSRFLADFTLGFADGLTVPFALTAGLSSLGRTETVIYAGMAEICAGSISMGIGGYLSARGDARIAAAAAAVRVEEEEEEEVVNEKAGPMVDMYLAPLDLPPELLYLVQEHIAGRVDVAAAVERQMAPDEEDEDSGPTPPWMSGLSVATGYLIGGSLPLFPYFIVTEVGDGLLWSFIVCVIALFSFGFVKDFVLHVQSAKAEAWVEDKDLRRAGWRWQDVGRSSWEGAQMVVLGSLAALAAVLCVRLFEGMGHE